MSESRRRIKLLIATAALALLLVPASAFAADLHVNDSGDAGDNTCEALPSECTLRDAADDAGDGDVIIIDAGVNPGLVTGPVAFNADVTIIGQGINATKIFRNSANQFRGIRIGNSNTATVEIRDLTIGGVGAEGFHANDGSDGNAGGTGFSGGGIENSETLTLDGVRVTGNRAGDGGDGTATGGGDGGHGGGIVTGDNTLTIKNSTIDLNVAGNGGAATTGNPGRGGHGGGIAQIGGDGSIVVTNSTISGNHAGNSGPRDAGENQTFGGNGGGVYAFGDSLEVTNSTISDNFAGNGSNGGVGSSALTATTGGVAGGIFAQSDPPDVAALASVTIAGNTAGNGGSSSGSGTGPAGNGGGIQSFDTVQVKNTLFDGNAFGLGTGGTNSTCGGDPLTDGGHNIEFPDATGCPAGFLHGDPDTSALAFNGGPTKTNALPPASFAIGKVPALDCTDLALAPLLTDQRGASRPLGEPCDIGAYELQPTPPATAPTVTPPPSTTPSTTPAAKKKCKKGRKLKKGKCVKKKKKKK